MSITFQIEGERIKWEDPDYDSFMNLNERNGLDLIAWLNFPAPVDSYGEIPARELAALCTRRLWPEDRNTDEGIAVVSAGRIHMGGRCTGYLKGRTEELLKLCNRAGDRRIVWS